eukprot:scaffold84956_cov70-Attheya_sp.AAC.3
MCEHRWIRDLISFRAERFSESGMRIWNHGQRSMISTCLLIETIVLVEWVVVVRWWDICQLSFLGTGEREVKNLVVDNKRGVKLPDEIMRSFFLATNHSSAVKWG